MKQYKRIILYNLLLSSVAFGLFLINFNPLRVTPSEEIENETNPLRLAQIRVDFPILAVHDPNIHLVKFYYPKSRRFSEQATGVGFSYKFGDKTVILREVYRDLDPLSHSFTGFTNVQINGKIVKIKSDKESQLTTIAWFDDLGVYRLEAKIEKDELLPLLTSVGRFTAFDETLAGNLKEVSESKIF